MLSCESRKTHKRLHRACIETLEQRRLLNAVINGVFVDTQTNELEYKQFDGSSVRISILGNVTAEFIFARVRPARFPDDFDALVLRDRVPAGSDEDGVDLFSIYVVQADINSVISIAQVPDPTTPARPMQPFDGSAGQLSVLRADEDQPLEIIQIENGPGAVFIGARTHDFQGPNAQDLNDRPIITPPDNRRTFGLRPSSAGQMFSGVEVAAGNDVGKFMLGGTITGLVDVPGSMRLFYAGGILTGDAGGLRDSQSSSIPNNFFIGGEIEQLVSGSSFGTSPGLDQEEIEDIQYKTGFDLQVNGRVGWIRTLDSFLGAADIANLESVVGLGVKQTELEFSGPTLEANSDRSYFDPVFFGDSASLGAKSRNPAYNNDSFDTAQWLGTLFSSELNSREAIQLSGFTFHTEGDSVDYYAVGLLAGQTMQVQLLQSATLRIGIFDPDGRLVATDYSNAGLGSNRLNQPFRFTADRPGPYRIAIANPGDTNFNGIEDPGEDIFFVSPNSYELRIQRVADIALGGLIADVHIATFDFQNTGITVRRGDIGSVRAGILGIGTIYSQSLPWLVERGNFRSMEAVSMGILRDNELQAGFGPDFLVPRGSAGLLRTTGQDPSNTIMYINEEYASIFDDVDLIDPALAVGVDIQLVESASNLEGNLFANRAIGVIRAVNISTFEEPPVWAVNVDKIGDDGIIDLIEISGSFGDLDQGGPAISTGPGGNVRYIRVIPQVDVAGADGIIDVQDLSGFFFTDRFFGGGQPQITLYEPGETARLTDDNGTAVNLTPVPLERAIDPVTGLPLPGLDNPGFLRVLTYPIRGKSGVVIVNATVYPGADGSGRGIQVSSGARGSGGSVEIGEIEIRSPGTEQDFDEFTRVFTPLLGGEIASVGLSGESPIDVWTIESRGPGSDAFTGLTSVNNNTGGEVVNVLAAHIQDISAETIGLARSTTGTAVEGIEIRLNGYPFNQQRNIVAAVNAGAPGHIVVARSRQGIGNLFAQGSIGSVVADSNRKNTRGVFEGINAPIYAAVIGTNPDTGNVGTVTIGEGVLSSGSGDVAFAGIYADNVIEVVRNTGLGRDIHGDIAASGALPVLTQVVNGVVQTTPTAVIGRINLTDGAIIGADILSVTNLEFAKENRDDFVIRQRTDPINAPVFDIQRIELNGIGGIIGSTIAAADVGTIEITGGFGFISSTVVSLGDGTINGIETDGYGLRSSFVSGGAVVNRIVARGTGKRIDTRFYSSSVRNSERVSFDPFTGYRLDGFNDLHIYLGTTAASPKRKGFSDAGVIEDTQIVAQRDLKFLEAHRIIGRNVFTTDPVTGRRVRISSGNLLYPMRVSFGNSVGTIKTRDVVDGLALITGNLTLFAPGNDVHYTQINVSGRIQNITAGGALRGTSSIKALGPEGQIQNLSTRRSLFATIDVRNDIGTMKVGTYLGSPLVRTGRHLNSLSVDNSILSGANVIVGGTLGSLTIGEDHEAGATIRADEIGTQQIGGQVLGDIIIT